MTDTLKGALRLAKILSHPIIVEPADPYVWDGEKTHAGRSISGIRRPAMNSREICHELAHRLVATSTERALPEWGLGKERSYGNAADLEPYVDRSLSYDIEDAARIVQVKLLAEIGDEPVVYEDAKRTKILHNLSALSACVDGTYKNNNIVRRRVLVGLDRLHFAMGYDRVVLRSDEQAILESAWINGKRQITHGCHQIIWDGLVDRGYLSAETHGDGATWTTYRITAKGHRKLTLAC